ncbi:PilZ domain-containing protein [Roseateles cellulosilyticus]|uniref:PilZ domain-containing protein n=1 Tax=Pelomonas cellulosilytica TaxID=2906762 RepID=A0ABS8XPW7_9BURK|nr:PilZ domain-containing protein [Pelomonas sp. P8]MCE4553188.1 PilZ domain-containing protein [Pelomonas sp. P8]
MTTANGETAPSSPTATAAERRVEERRAYRSTATVIAGTHQFQVRTLDISRSGMCIVAAINPQPNLRFKLRMRLDRQPQGPVTVEADVQVVHSVLASQESGFRIGLRFVNPGSQLLGAVNNFLGK